MANFALPDAAQIGYAHLRVRDLGGALAFYQDLLGLREVRRVNGTAYLSATGEPPYHVIVTEQPGARQKPPRTAGLYHVAIRLPDRDGLARVLRRLLENDYPLQGASDHGVSEAIYLADPDGNGLELYCDRPRAQWQWDGTQIGMGTDPLDGQDLLAQASSEPWNGIAPGTDIGHVHLHVSDLGRAEAFYCDLLGFEVMQRSYPGALFVAAGGYHHHLGLNIWAGRDAPPAPTDAVGLIAFSLRLPEAAAWQALVDRVRAAGVPVETPPANSGTDSVLIRDSDRIGVVLAYDGEEG
ncbi:MAG: VOC family protein [Chloroflexi bacterium]|nr:VOC family protein [Chloroflexota bacterium]